MKRIIAVFCLVAVSVISFSFTKPIDSYLDLDGIEGVIPAGKEYMSFRDLYDLQIWDMTEYKGRLLSNLDCGGKVLGHIRNEKIFPGLIISTFVVDNGGTKHMRYLRNGDYGLNPTIQLPSPPTATPVPYFHENILYFIYGTYDGRIFIISSKNNGFETIQYSSNKIEVLGNHDMATIVLMDNGNRVVDLQVDFETLAYQELFTFSYSAVMEAFDQSNTNTGESLFHIYLNDNSLNRLTLTEAGFSNLNLGAFSVNDAAALEIVEDSIAFYDGYGNPTVFNADGRKVISRNTRLDRQGSTRLISAGWIFSDADSFSVYNTIVDETETFSRSNHFVTSEQTPFTLIDIVTPSIVYLQEDPMFQVLASITASVYPYYLTSYIRGVGNRNGYIFPLNTDAIGYREYQSDISHTEASINDLSVLPTGEYEVVTKIMSETGWATEVTSPFEVEVSSTLFLEITDCDEYFSPDNDGCSDNLNVTYSAGTGGNPDCRIYFEVSNKDEVVFSQIDDFASGSDLMFNWDGVNDSGTTASNGLYSLKVALKDNSLNTLKEDTCSFFINVNDYSFILSSSETFQDEGNFNVSPIWTSDSDHFYFLRCRIQGCYDGLLQRTYTISGDAQIWLGDTNGSYDLVLDTIVDPDNPVVINPNQYFTASPIPSPSDHTVLALIRAGDLYALLGTDLVFVAENIPDENYCWAPDGSYLLYCSNTEGIKYTDGTQTVTVLPSGVYNNISKPSWCLNDMVFFISLENLYGVNILTGEVAQYDGDTEYVEDYTHLNDETKLVYLYTEASSSDPGNFAIIDYSLPAESMLIRRHPTDLSGIDRTLIVSEDNSKLFYVKNDIQYQGANCDIIGGNIYVGAETVEVHYIDLLMGVKRKAFEYTSPLGGGYPSISSDSHRILFSTYGGDSSALKNSLMDKVAWCEAGDSTPPYVEMELDDSTIQIDDDLTLSGTDASLRMLLPSNEIQQEYSGVVNLVCKGLDDGIIQMTEIYLDGKRIAVKSADKVSTKIDTGQYASGMHIFKGVSYDSSGNKGIKERMVYFIGDTNSEDAEAPETRISYSHCFYSNGDTSLINGAQIFLGATDNVDPAPLTYFSIVDENTGTHLFDDALYMGGINTFGLGTGYFIIEYWSSDRTGNIEDKKAARLKLMDGVHYDVMFSEVLSPLVFINIDDVETVDSTSKEIAKMLPTVKIVHTANEFENLLGRENYNSISIIGDNEVLSEGAWKKIENRISKGLRYISFKHLRKREVNEFSEIFGTRFNGYLPKSYMLNIDHPDFTQSSGVYSIYDVMKVDLLDTGTETISSVTFNKKTHPAIMRRELGDGEVILNAFLTFPKDLASILLGEVSYLEGEDIDSEVIQCTLNLSSISGLETRAFITFTGPVQFISQELNDIYSRDSQLKFSSMGEDITYQFRFLRESPPISMEVKTQYKLDGAWYDQNLEEYIVKLEGSDEIGGRHE